MNTILATVLLLAQATTSPAPTLKSILLEQLKTTHNNQDWFVPAVQSVAGMTFEQAAWKDGNVNHSVAQLVSHLVYWNTANLAKFKGEKPPAYTDNDATFVPISDKATWDAAVKQLDAVMTELEKLVEAADETKLKSWYGTIAHISTHNAYHTGQILYIRKQQGSWDPAKGVK